MGNPKKITYGHRIVCRRSTDRKIPDTNTPMAIKSSHEASDIWRSRAGSFGLQECITRRLMDVLANIEMEMTIQDVVKRCHSVRVPLNTPGQISTADKRLLFNVLFTSIAILCTQRTNWKLSNTLPLFTENLCLIAQRMLLTIT